MNKLLLCLLSSMLFSSCESSTENFKFNNDLENIDGWFDQKQIVKGDAHSGNYLAEVLPEQQYSITFRRYLSDLNNGKPIKNISAGAWVMLTQINSSGKFVLSIDEPSTLKPIKYSSIKLQDVIGEPGKWFFVQLKVEIPESNISNKLVSIYTINDGNFPVFVDDISYQFE